MNQKTKLLIPLSLLAFFLILEISLLSSCAQIVAPQGGPRDTIPPQLDSAESTPNYMLNFQKQPIELKFDEFVQLTNVFEQVIVSPPLAFNPEVTLDKYKTVRFEFDEAEVLRENATYIINFGDAIKDYTEGNITTMRFIFSTGDYIDSLSVSGQVVDVTTGNAVKDVLVMLYDNLSDTVVRTERPFYFGRTDDNGNFKIENIKADTLKVFVLKDADPPNYLYDNETEGIGFLDTFIITSDSTPGPLRISFFQPEPNLRLVETNKGRYGLLKLSFNREPYDAKIDYDDFGQFFFQETVEDSIRVWYDWSSSDSFNIYVTADTLTDTILIKSTDKRQAFVNETKIRVINGIQGGRTQTLNPFKPQELKFNHPIDAIDASKIQLLKDSVQTPVDFEMIPDSINPRSVFLKHNWTEMAAYKLILLPGAITDVYGIRNDTIRQNYRPDERKNFGNILLTIDQLDSTKQYVFEVLKGTELIKSYAHKNSSIFTIDLKHLSPGDYKLEIVEDTNGNGRWDPGAYENYRPSEKRFSKTLEQLRANWDLEATISLEDSE